MARNPNISIGFSQSKFAQEVNKMATELKAVKKEFEITNLAIEATGNKSALAQNKLKGFSEEVKILRNAAASMQKGLEDATNAQSKLAARTEAAKQAYEKAASAENKSKTEVDKLKKEYENLVSRLSKADKAVANWKNKLQDSQLAENKLKVAISQTNKEIEEQNKRQAENIKNTRNVTTATGQLLNIYTLIKGIALGYAGKTLYEALIGGNAQFEQYMASFEVLLGGAEQAQKRMNELTVFAAKTPFELPQVVEAEKRLLAYGVSAKDTAKVMQTLGDISMGNAEKLNMISLAYGQVVTNQKLYGSELRQFAENGVPLLAELAKMYGVTEAQMRKMVEDGQISADAVTAALQRMTSEGGKFFGMMDKQSQTMQGMWSTIRDNINMFAREVGEEGFDYLKGEMADFMDTLDQMSQSGELGDIARDWGRYIAEFVGFVVDAIKTLWDMKEALAAAGIAIGAFKVSMAIGNTVMAVVNSIESYTAAVKTGTTATAALTTVMKANPWVLLASAIAAVVAGIIGYNLITKDATTETDKLAEKTAELTEEYERNQKAIDKQTNSQLGELSIAQRLAGELDELSKRTKKTAEDKSNMAHIVDQLNEKIPNLALAINSETGELNKQIGVVYNAIDAYRQLLFVKASEKKAGAAAESILGFEKQKKQLESQLKPYEQAMSQYKKYKLDQQLMQMGGKPIGGKADSFPGISEKELADYNKLASQYNDVLDKIKDAENQINESFRASEEYAKKYGTTGSKSNNVQPNKPPPLLNGKDKSIKDAEKAKKEAIQKAFEDLKYQKEMEYITEAEYYKKLENLRDKYYKRGTQEWQQYTVQIKQYIDKSKEDTLKAEAEKYKERLQNSGNWISDQKHYGKLSSDEEIAAYERIRNYVKEYYSKGIVDKKEYQAQMRELDKNIFDARKSALEEEIKVSADAQKKILDVRKKSIENEAVADKKRFDARKKAIEDEYNLIDRNERQTERSSKLTELSKLENIYQGAVTAEGKNKLREIREEIKSLNREAEKEQRDLLKKASLDALENERVKAEEERSKKLEDIGKEYENLDTQQQALLKNIANYASLTAGTLEQVTNRIKSLLESINGYNSIGIGVAGSASQSVYNLYQTNNNNITDPISANIFGSYLGGGFLRFLPGVR